MHQVHIVHGCTLTPKAVRDQFSIPEERFRDLDAETGDVLWEVNLGSPVTGFPIIYAIEGRQYVAVSTGNSSAVAYFAPLTPELRPGMGNNLFVFALPD